MRSPSENEGKAKKNNNNSRKATAFSNFIFYSYHTPKSLKGNVRFLLALVVYSSSAALFGVQIILLGQAQDQNAQDGVSFYFRNWFVNDILMLIII